MKLNERTWVGQIISWIKEEITEKRTVFQDAMNDAGIKLESGKTKFPDILLFADKTSGTLFNGWELKFPDTDIDNEELLENALEKAKRIGADSFVTWNGSAAVIWKIQNEEYSTQHIIRLKVYPREASINTRDDLANPEKYRQHEPLLKKRLNEILHDLQQLYLHGELRQAINVSYNFIQGIQKAATIIIPQFTREIINLNKNKDFRQEFEQWKVYESSTLKMLSTSSRRPEKVIEEEVLAKHTFYNLIGKILFYLTLSENLPGSLQKIALDNPQDLKQKLDKYFDAAKKIDYQAVFKPYFTNSLPFNASVNKALFELLERITEFDFKVLPTDVIGTILENLVPKEEKQKFGQYFTSGTLSNLVAFPAIRNKEDKVFDPTSGTGTFLNSFYQILKYYGNTDHVELLDQIWGNDISHFPAILSVINLYKQKVSLAENFPRVIREDYFNLVPGKKINFPTRDPDRQIEQTLPAFDAIISNFPFIQQEDIPNKILSESFREEFQSRQRAFINGSQFGINERSDYFVYCFYNSLKFLKADGYISAITSNAWLGKNYGTQFKVFLLDNFSVRYVFCSNAEHWFKDSKVTTIFTTVQRTKDNMPTRFVTLKVKLDDYFAEDKKDSHIEMVEALYREIDHCDAPGNDNWTEDGNFPNVFHKNDGTVSVSIVERAYLEQQIYSQENWAINFLAQDPLQQFNSKLIKPFPELMDVGRGTRADTDEFQILAETTVNEKGIEELFLVPAIKSSRELASIHHTRPTTHFLFHCSEPESLLVNNYPNAWKWIQSFSEAKNKKGELYPIVLAKRKPHWYTLRVEKPANIFISINPNDKLFFAYSTDEVYLNQRLVAIRPRQGQNVELIAAIFNSIVSLLIVELNGVSRSLGALDLNADFFQTKMKILNPDLLPAEAKDCILKAFRPLAKRPIKNYDTEYQQADRVLFDQTVLSEFGYDVAILPKLYEIMVGTIRNRIEMKDR